MRNKEREREIEIETERERNKGSERKGEREVEGKSLKRLIEMDSPRVEHHRKAKLFSVEGGKKFVQQRCRRLDRLTRT